METITLMEPCNTVKLFCLSNGNIDVVLCNYGCTIVSINVPDKTGRKSNIVAGFSNPEDYKKDHPYLGSTVGRFANRIANGKFKIDDKEYQLTINDHFNHLHGGIQGFHRKVWQAEENSDGITFSYLSGDGEEGFPGNLRVSVLFTLSACNKLNIRYSATTDKKTIVNLTNHSYFNLSGFESPTIHNHLLKVYAGKYTVKNQYNIPSGQIENVSYTPYDFTTSKLIGKDIGLLKKEMGYDINYVLDKNISTSGLAAELYEPVSGRLMKVFTDQPGMQLYTANWWDGSILDPKNWPYLKHGAVALETQAFPDAPNHPNFPNTILTPGQLYQSITTYQFLTS